MTAPRGNCDVILLLDMKRLLQNLTSTVNLLPKFGVGLFGYNDLWLEHMENGKAEDISSSKPSHKSIGVIKKDLCYDPSTFFFLKAYCRVDIWSLKRRHNTYSCKGE